MTFQRFEHARKDFSPKASISTAGKLSLNEGAVRLWNLENLNLSVCFMMLKLRELVWSFRG